MAPIQEEKFQAENKFLELEYTTLRKEIEDAKGRAFKILAGEAFAIPAAQFLIGVKLPEEERFVIIFLPVLILILVLRFLYENNSIIRCGIYIRYHIEPHMKLPSKAWEEWLEDTGRIKKRGNRNYCPREVEKTMKQSFYLLSIIYYIFSVLLAKDFVEKYYNSIHFFGYTINNTSIILLIIYSLLCITMLVLCQRLQTTTRMS